LKSFRENLKWKYNTWVLYGIYQKEVLQIFWVHDSIDTICVHDSYDTTNKDWEAHTNLWGRGAEKILSWNTITKEIKCQVMQETRLMHATKG